MSPKSMKKRYRPRMGDEMAPRKSFARQTPDRATDTALVRNVPRLRGLSALGSKFATAFLALWMLEITLVGPSPWGRLVEAFQIRSPSRPIKRIIGAGASPFASQKPHRKAGRRRTIPLFDSETTTTEIDLSSISSSSDAPASAAGPASSSVPPFHNATNTVQVPPAANGVQGTPSTFPDFLHGSEENEDVPRPTANGGFTHTAASRAKISAANKGKKPWNKGKRRSEAVRARIAAGVRAKNRERFLQKLKDMGVTEEEYEAQKKEERRKREAERRARRTEKGGYRPTEETKQKISKILKEKYAKGQMKPRKVDPSKVRRGFTHSAETRAKIAESMRKRWANDSEYRANMVQKATSVNSSADVRKKISESLRKKWQDPEFRDEMLSKMASRRRPSGSHDAEHREKISAAMKARWQDEDYRKKTLAAITRRRDAMVKLQPPKPPAKPKAPRKKKQIVARKEKRPRTLEASERSAIPSVTVLQPRTEPRKKEVKATQRRTSKPASAHPKKEELPVASTPIKKQPKAPKAAAAISTNKTKNGTTRAQKTKSKKNGSVSRLREERRDLYDLLYGDENEGEPAKNSLSSLFNLGDEDLDSFDPYGLEDC